MIDEFTDHYLNGILYSINCFKQRLRMSNEEYRTPNDEVIAG